MEENDGIDVDTLTPRKEDQLLLYHAILGHDLAKIIRMLDCSWQVIEILLGSLWESISVRCSVLRGLRRYANNMD